MAPVLERNWALPAARKSRGRLLWLLPPPQTASANYSYKEESESEKGRPGGPLGETFAKAGRSVAAPYGDPGRPGQGRRAVAWGAEAEMNSRLGSSQPRAWRVLGSTTR